MSNKTIDALKTLKQLGFGTFKLPETYSYGNSKNVWELLNHYDKTYKDLKIEDPNEQAKLFKLLEYK